MPPSQLFNLEKRTKLRFPGFEENFPLFCLLHQLRNVLEEHQESNKVVRSEDINSQCLPGTFKFLLFTIL